MKALTKLATTLLPLIALALVSGCVVEIDEEQEQAGTEQQALVDDGEQEGPDPTPWRALEERTDPDPTPWNDVDPASVEGPDPTPWRTNTDDEDEEPDPQPWLAAVGAGAANANN